MAQQTINNAESGLSVRNKLNSMFGELYGSLLLPFKILGVNANTSFAIPANTYIKDIFITTTAGAPTIRIGTTPNGTEILPDTNPGSISEADIQQYFSGAATAYITIAGGTVSIRMTIINNFF